MRVVRPVLSFLAAVLFAACSVDEGTLETTLYRCSSTPECGPGYGCTVGSAVVGFDFCAPLPSTCNATTCDGVCRGDGTCLHGCDLHADGSTGPCQVAGTSCVRYASTTRGACFPARSCDRDEDCGGGLCVSTLIRDAMDRNVPDQLCLPRPTATTCPTGYVYISFLTGLDLCVPVCAGPTNVCPPTFGCFAVGRLFELAQNPCFPGVLGLSCTDDANCIAGRCLTTAAAGTRICSLRCSEAEAVPGSDCGSIDGADLLSRFRTWQCDRSVDVCAPRYKVGFPCNEGYPCQDGLTCEPIDFGGGSMLNVCTRDCATDADCPTEGFCSALNKCFSGLEDGSMCSRNRQCQSLRCTAGACAPT